VARRWGKMGGGGIRGEGGGEGELRRHVVAFPAAKTTSWRLPGLGITHDLWRLKPPRLALAPSS